MTECTSMLAKRAILQSFECRKFCSVCWEHSRMTAHFRAFSTENHASDTHLGAGCIRSEVRLFCEILETSSTCTGSPANLLLLQSTSSGTRRPDARNGDEIKPERSMMLVVLGYLITCWMALSKHTATEERCCFLIQRCKSQTNYHTWYFTETASRICRVFTRICQVSAFASG